MATESDLFKTLKAARDKQEPWLLEQPGYNSSYIGVGKRTPMAIILHFHPLSADLVSKVEEKFHGFPVEVYDVPMAIAQTSVG